MSYDIMNKLERLFEKKISCALHLHVYLRSSSTVLNHILGFEQFCRYNAFDYVTTSMIVVLWC